MVGVGNSMDSKIIEKFLNKSGKEKILIVVLIGVLMLVVAIPVKSDTNASDSSGGLYGLNDASQQALSDYDVYMEQRIEKLLAEVEGGGKDNVMVTMGQTDDKTVEGVVIVAEGGGNGSVASNITSALEALLGIPAHKIKVLKMS